MRFKSGGVFFCLLVSAFAAWAQTPASQHPALSPAAHSVKNLIELTPPDGTVGGWFGQSVAIGGDTIAVTSYKSNAGFGKVYVYVKPSTGWQDATLTAELTTSGFSGIWVGAPVAISPDGSTIVVNGGFDTVTSYSKEFVYVKPSSGWVNMNQTATLWAIGGGVFDFGWSIATDGDNVLVGGLGCSGNGDFSPGAAYLFVKPAGGWTDMTETGYLEESDPIGCDDYGSSVAINRVTAVVGRTGAGMTPPVSPGALYVFAKPVGGWTTMTQTAKLEAYPNFLNDGLGRAVSLSGNTILAPVYLQGSPNSGASIFVKPAAGWANGTETATLTNTTNGVKQIGYGSALDRTVAAIIANYGGEFTGIKALNLYDEPAGGWQNASAPNSSVVPPDETANDDFGLRAVAMQNGTIVVGSLAATRNGNSGEGAVYIFQAQ